MIIDLHSHTSPRSACSSLQPAELIKQAKEIGLDGFCLTEHNQIWPKDAVDRLIEESGLVILRGVEVSTNVGHVLVYGLNDYPLGTWDVRRLRQAVDAGGGVMILAHPLRDTFYRPSQAEIPLLFDAIEVLNGTESAQHNATALALSLQLKLRGVGGSDSHTVREVATCATVFDGDIRDERDLVEALKGNGYSPRQLR